MLICASDGTPANLIGPAQSVAQTQLSGRRGLADDTSRQSSTTRRARNMSARTSWALIRLRENRREAVTGNLSGKAWLTLYGGGKPAHCL